MESQPIHSIAFSLFWRFWLLLSIVLPISMAFIALSGGAPSANNEMNLSLMFFFILAMYASFYLSLLWMKRRSGLQISLTGKKK